MMRRCVSGRAGRVYAEEHLAWEQGLARFLERLRGGGGTD